MEKMKFSGKCFCWLISLLGLSVQAQQISLQGFHYKDPYKLIPAFGGLEGTLFASATFRNQWQGIAGQPQTFDLRVNLPLYLINSGAGLAIGKDETGLGQILYVQPSFNRVFHFDQLLFSAAAQFQYAYHNFSGQLARTPDGDYTNGQIDHKDPLLDTRSSNFQRWDAGISVAFQYDLYKFGLAVSGIFENGKASLPVPYRNTRHYLLHASYEWAWGRFKFLPTFALYSDLKSSQTEIFLGGEYNGNIFGGMHIRGYDDNSIESLGISFGFELSSKWSVGYLHEFYLGKITGSQLPKSQEFGLFYHFGKAIGEGKKPPVLRSPRYFD
ncbi:MAG: PorP/SprF family type IX secretion system membrane protein [Saprospiraceae bacterium]|nr:PorP/SprF family type IX secretion system membrane protein [Saprospiraceae bacterium]